MYVKLMSDQNLPDNDSRKSFRLLANVEAVFFNRHPEAPEGPEGKDWPPTAYMTFSDGTQEGFALVGNVYILSDSGKTIEKFGIHPIATEEFPASVRR